MVQKVIQLSGQRRLAIPGWKPLDGVIVEGARSKRPMRELPAYAGFLGPCTHVPGSGHKKGRPKGDGPSAMSKASTDSQHPLGRTGSLPFQAWHGNGPCVRPVGTYCPIPDGGDHDGLHARLSGSRRPSPVWQDRTHHENVGNRQRRHVTKDVAPESPLDRAAPKAQCQSEPCWPSLAQMHDPIPCILPLEV